MTARETFERSAAAIQPHGLLLVIDQATDLIMQAAGDASTIVGFAGTPLGRRAAEVLGVSLADLIRRTDTVVLNRPVFLGTIRPDGGVGELAVTAHRVAGATIVEVSPWAGHVSAATTLSMVRSITESLGAAAGLIEACDIAAGEVWRVTGYDRVMIQRFLGDGSCSVIAEARLEELSPLLNHRFPASDYSEQARELYRRNPIEVIPDVGYNPAPLEPPLCPATNQPLDMGECVLRGAPSAHLQYLTNMGVAASMVVSLLPRADLWGLIVCHNRVPRHSPYEARDLCRHVAQILSQQIRAHEDSYDHRVSRELAVAGTRVGRALVEAADPQAALLDLASDLGAMVPSQGVAAYINATVAIAGRTPSEAQVRKLVAWLETRLTSQDIYATECLSDVYPEAGAFASRAAGLLSIVLTRDDLGMVIWFRIEKVEKIRWAGNPDRSMDAGSPPGALAQGKSFVPWQETVRGRARPWTPREIEAARAFGSRAAFVLQQHRLTRINARLAEANNRLSALSLTDALTGVPNRRAFDENLNREWARARRAGAPLAMVMLDLDYFKQYNDEHGHVMGDECLKRIGRILNGALRGGDFAARIGGEEFSILLPDTDIVGAVRVGENIRARIEQQGLPHPGSSIGVMTASLGVSATSGEKRGTARTLIEAADRALYQAKQAGRNRVLGA